MTNEKLQTAKMDAPQSSAALKFVKHAAGTDGQQNAETAESKAVENKDAVKSQRQDTAVPHVQTVETLSHKSLKVVGYQPFSTRLRGDLKRRLKRLSHYREETGHEIRSVQQFVELAICHWLDSQEEPPAF